MKYLFILFAFISTAYAGTCTSISRVNNQPNAVLTSTKYNADINDSYNNQNAYDLGCGTDGTLEDGSLNTTDFAVPLNGVRQGCQVNWTDGNTLSIDRCLVSVNGKWVKTTAATSVTWLCSGCSAEASDAWFYVYVSSASSGSTITPLILTGAPNGDGFDGSSNRVLAAFYNGSGGAISRFVKQWNNGFQGGGKSFGCKVSNNGSSATLSGTSCHEWLNTAVRNSTGKITLTLDADVALTDEYSCTCSADATSDVCNANASAGTNTVDTNTGNNATGTGVDDDLTIICSTPYFGGVN